MMKSKELRRAEDDFNIAQPAYILAIADQRDFIPEINIMQRTQLVEVAKIYKANIEGRATNSKLRITIIDVINNRVNYTRKEYECALNALEELEGIER
jgi:hypothetical protein